MLKEAAEASLECILDFPAEREFHVGLGSAISLRGWAYSRDAQIRDLQLSDGRRTFTVLNHSWPRLDVMRAHFPERDPHGHSLRSEFLAALPVAAVEAPEKRELHLRATLSTGRIATKHLATLDLLPGGGETPLVVDWQNEGPRVAICMAAYNPEPILFQRQINSIQSQEHRNWICIITDDSASDQATEQIRAVIGGDPRFHYVRNEQRLGFYRNFEACLRLVPADAEFVALSDHDDCWYPDKISALLAAVGTKAMAYSDCRITSDKEIISETFWSTRRNNFKDLSSLFIANTVTGAACLFRRSLLPRILPFPQYISDTYHDQWIALVAFTSGGIAYVDRPLYEYHQHASNVVGHRYGRMPGSAAALRRFWRIYRSRQLGMLGAVQAVMNEARGQFPLAIQKSIFAKTLELRNPQMSRRDLKVIRRIASYPDGLLEPLRQKALATALRRPTLNVEGMLLWAAFGVRLRNAYYRLRTTGPVRAAANRRRRLQAANQMRLAPVLPAPAAEPPPQVAPVQAAPPAIEPAGDLNGTGWNFHSIEPLKLDVSRDEPRRVNLILATIDFRTTFGGYLGMFHLALRLKREGLNVRIVLTEPTQFNPDQWREDIQKYPGVTNLFDEVELAYRFDRSEPVRCSPDDQFIATNCRAAHIAHKAHEQLGKERFMFMVQEYEPLFLPMNSISALFQQSYRFPQFDLFSTTHLRDFFRQQKLGVFAGPDGRNLHAVFHDAILKFSPRVSDMSGRERRILFDGHPERHAARSLYELGMKALADLVASPDFDRDEWKLFAMGSMDAARKLHLAPGVDIELMPKLDLQADFDRLPQHDVGLSLMLAPHPSLVPLEMAAAGMWAVTNTFMNKTAESLQAVSSNIIAIEPTLEGVVGGLKEAMSRVDHYDERIKGAEVNWPTDWRDAFSQDSMRKIMRFLSST
ncbi:MAG TPA: glycosyltransferase [Mesorhizobium sp.]|jgi:glycosyltransferase involved in cell wall biosynthesis|nr:glycosyltransferase [Mesorhizobium sp.]